MPCFSIHIDDRSDRRTSEARPGTVHRMEAKCSILGRCKRRQSCQPIGGQVSVIIGGALKILSAKYLRDSATRSDSRCVGEVLTLADKEFARPSQEATLIALNQMMNIQRKPNGNIRPILASILQAS